MTASPQRARRRTTVPVGTRSPAASLRLAEPAPTAGRVVADGLVTISLTLLIGAGAGFLVGLGAWLTLEEGFPDVWRDQGLDPVSRTSLGYVSVVLVGGIVLYSLSSAASRALLGRRLATLSVTHPERVPVRALRTRLFDLDPVTPLFGLCLLLLGVAGLAAAVVAPLLISDRDTVGHGWTVLGASVLVMLLVGLALSLLRGRGRRAWEDLTDGPRQTWAEGAVLAAVRTENRLRPSPVRPLSVGRVHRLARRAQRPLATGGAILVAAGAAVGFLAVVIRQPGRNADERSYGERGEQAIDVIITSGAALALAGTVVLVLALVAATLVTARERAALRRLARADDAGTWRPEDSILRRAVEVPALLLVGGVVALGLATTVGSTTLALLHVADDPTHPLTASRDTIESTAWAVLVLALLGAAAVIAGTPAGPRFRQVVRETWHPGDDPAPRTTSG